MTGIGTIDNPYDLITCLTQTYVKAGDTIWLRGGTYPITNLAVSLAGVSGKPLLVKAYAGESPVIDGGITLSGGYIRFQGIRFTNSGWTNRESAQVGDTPGDLETFNNVIATGSGLEFINCRFDNGRQGIGWYGQGGMMYGCLVQHNGWKSPGTQQGHGIYVQNNTPRKTIKNTIVVDNFGWGIHGWSNDQNKVHRITLDGIIAYNNGSPSGLTVPNFSLVNMAQVEQELTVINSRTYQPTGENTQNAVGASAATDVTFDNNYTPEHTELGGVATFLSKTGNYDGPAIGNEVSVVPNEYDTERAHVAIYNQAEANTVDVDVSAVFDNGDVIDVHNAQDYDDDVQQLMVAAGVVTVNMQAANRTVASPYGWTAPPKSFPQFGAFILVRQL